MAKISTVLDHFRILLRRDPGLSPDHELLQRFTQQRDEEAFAGLVRRHGPMVLGVCRRVLHGEEDAEDAFQATFLVLARKANTLDGRGSLANWLHKVSLNLSIDARRRNLHRRETPVANLPEPCAGQESCSEIKQCLDAEIERLPAKLRLPLVYCCLQGKSAEEAARELGCSRDAIRGRLNQGREMLRKRLSRTAGMLSPALLAAVVAEDSACAAVPASLVAATAKAAVMFAAGQSQSISSSAVSLAEGGLSQMFMTKVKKVLAVLVVGLVVCAGVGLAAHQVLAGKPEAAQQAKAAAVPSDDKQNEKDKATEVKDASLRVSINHMTMNGPSRFYPSLPRKGKPFSMRPPSWRLECEIENLTDRRLAISQPVLEATDVEFQFGSWLTKSGAWDGNLEPREKKLVFINGKWTSSKVAPGATVQWKVTFKYDNSSVNADGNVKVMQGIDVHAKCTCGCTSSQEMIAELRQLGGQQARGTIKKSLAEIAWREEMGLATPLMLAHRQRLLELLPDIRD